MGRFPYATLHYLRTKGMGSAVEFQRRVNGLSQTDAVLYVLACIKTDGQPHLIDLYE